MNLRGKVAIITGASSGIGWETARALAAAGADVVLAARNGERLQQLSGELKRYPVRILVTPVDMSKPESVTRLIACTVEEMGGLDILVNNAGIGIGAGVEDLDLAKYEYVQRVNVLGPLQAIQAAVPVMRRRGGGVIVNISSILGKRSMPYSGAYCATKWALQAFSEAARVELAHDNIRVVVVYPGITRTAFNYHVVPGTRKAEEIPQRVRPPRGASPDRVAKTIMEAIRHERREAYVTLPDRLFVLGAQVFPGLADWGLGFYARRAGIARPQESPLGQPRRKALTWLGLGAAGLAILILNRSRSE